MVENISSRVVQPGIYAAVTVLLILSAANDHGKFLISARRDCVLDDFALHNVSRAFRERTTPQATAFVSVPRGLPSRFADGSVPDS